MSPILEETIYLDFITSAPTTGTVSDADSTPTCEVFEDANDTAILTPTCTKRTSKTGNYRVPIACTTANGFEVNKSYNVIISATVGGVTAKARIATFQVRAACALAATALSTADWNSTVLNHILASFYFSTSKRSVDIVMGSPVLTIYESDNTTPFIAFDYNPTTLTLTPQ